MKPEKIFNVLVTFKIDEEGKRILYKWNKPFAEWKVMGECPFKERGPDLNPKPKKQLH